MSSKRNRSKPRPPASRPDAAGPRRFHLPRNGRGRPASLFDRCAGTVTRWTGSPAAFGLAVLAIAVWGISGPLFGYSETWQLVVNTGTTIVTFLMVFLIQQSQNKDSRALHLKLDELLHAVRGASEEMVDIEDLGEDQLKEIADFYARMAARKRQSGPAW